jgi:hypothetical protein
MLDPVSAVGAIASGVQLLDAGGRALLGCYDLIRNVKNAPKEMVDMLKELESSIKQMHHFSDTIDGIINQRLTTFDNNQILRVKATALEIKLAADELLKSLQTPFAELSAERNGFSKPWHAFKAVIKGKDLRKSIEKVQRLQDSLRTEIGFTNIMNSTLNRYVEVLNCSIISFDSSTFLLLHYSPGIRCM